jgi:hypothetical protein
MPAPGAAIAAVAAGNVAFSRDAIADGKAGHLRADFDNFAAVLVSHRHGYGNGFLRPRVPLVYVHVGAANSGLAYADAHVVGTERRWCDVLQLDAGRGAVFD